MKELSFRKVLDREGAFQHLEIIQGNNIITLLFSDASLMSKPSNTNWTVLKEVLDTIQEQIAGETAYDKR